MYNIEFDVVLIIIIIIFNVNFNYQILSDRVDENQQTSVELCEMTLIKSSISIIEACFIKWHHYRQSQHPWRRQRSANSKRSALNSSQSVHDGRSARLVALQRGNMSRLPALFALQALIVFVIAEHNGLCKLSYCKCVPAKHPLRTNINCTVPGNKVLNSISNKVFMWYVST